MAETQLTGRGIFMVVLVVVMLFAGMMMTAMIVSPSTRDPIGARNTVVVCGIVGALALAWFIRLTIASVRDRRRGVAKAPPQVSGLFDVWFGAAVAAGGILCSALTYRTSLSADGVWTLYWGMIFWGIVQSLVGLNKIRRSRVRDDRGVPTMTQTSSSIDFTVTANAARQVATVAKEFKIEGAFKAIAGVKPDGSYTLDLSQESLDQKDWFLFQSSGVDVAISRGHAGAMQGMSVDWRKQDGAEGFVFEMQDKSSA